MSVLDSAVAEMGPSKNATPSKLEPLQCLTGGAEFYPPLSPIPSACMGLGAIGATGSSVGGVRYEAPQPVSIAQVAGDWLAWFSGPALACLVATASVAPMARADSSASTGTRTTSFDFGGSEGLIAGEAWLPTPRSAPARIKALREVVADWREPFVTTSAFDETVLEWWNGKKKVTIYFESDKPYEFVKVWGDDFDDGMSDGTLHSASDFRDLWNWLLQ